MTPYAKAMLMGVAGSASALNVADVFSVDLRTGGGSAQSVTNGIDFSTHGGLLWSKYRTDPLGALNATEQGHFLASPSLGTTSYLQSNTTAAAASIGAYTFASNGYTVPNTVAGGSATYVDWSFRQAPKFFDVVTFVAGVSANQRIQHALGVEPGLAFIKRLAGAQNWYGYHRSLGRGYYTLLQSTAAATAQSNFWGSSDPTSTDIGIDAANFLNAGENYIAYLWAHDPSPSGIIQCGSYTGNGSSTGPTISLGWQPQFLLLKAGSRAANWYIFDSARGLGGSTDKELAPNSSGAEANFLTPGNLIDVSGSGFSLATSQADINANGDTYIYMAIRAES